MNRHQVEALLIEASSNAMVSPDFRVSFPCNELPAVLNILKHLEASGQLDSYSHRDAEADCDCATDECGCVNIYGYTG